MEDDEPGGSYLRVIRSELREYVRTLCGVEPTVVELFSLDRFFFEEPDSFLSESVYVYQGSVSLTFASHAVSCTWRELLTQAADGIELLPDSWREYLGVEFDDAQFAVRAHELLFVESHSVLPGSDVDVCSIAEVAVEQQQDTVKLCESGIRLCANARVVSVEVDRPMLEVSVPALLGPEVVLLVPKGTVVSRQGSVYTAGSMLEVTAGDVLNVFCYAVPARLEFAVDIDGSKPRWRTDLFGYYSTDADFLPGFCYLSAFADPFRVSVARDLGPYPMLSVLIGYVRRFPEWLLWGGRRHHFHGSEDFLHLTTDSSGSLFSFVDACFPVCVDFGKSAYMDLVVGVDKFSAGSFIPSSRVPSFMDRAVDVDRGKPLFGTIAQCGMLGTLGVPVNDTGWLMIAANETVCYRFSQPTYVWLPPGHKLELEMGCIIDSAGGDVWIKVQGTVSWYVQSQFPVALATYVLCDDVVNSLFDRLFDGVSLVEAKLRRCYGVNFHASLPSIVVSQESDPAAALSMLEVNRSLSGVRARFLEEWVVLLCSGVRICLSYRMQRVGYDVAFILKNVFDYG